MIEGWLLPGEGTVDLSPKGVDVNAFSSNRIVIDWSEIDAVGPYCGSDIAMAAWPPPTGLLAEVVGPFLRDRERYRRVLVANIIAQMSATGSWLTIAHQFDGGECPHLLASMITTTPKE